MAAPTSRQTVQFHSEKIVCEGDLFLPAGFDRSRHYPALVVGHGFSVARTSLVEEGRLFAEAGYIALTIDYRHFGTSGGEPRGRLWPLQETEDVKSAIDWLEIQPGVDANRIGVWGTSFGAGIMTHVAAYDLRVKVCVAQAPILSGSAWLQSLNRETDFLALRHALTQARRARARDGGDPVMNLAAPPPKFNPLPADPVMIDDVMSWHAKTGDWLMHSAPALTIESFERVLEFDAVHAASKIAPRAYCMIQLNGRDVYHPNYSIQAAYQSAGEPKQMVSIPIDQLDCYKPDGRAKTIAAAIGFFNMHLSP